MSTNQFWFYIRMLTVFDTIEAKNNNDLGRNIQRMLEAAPALTRKEIWNVFWKFKVKRGY